MNGHWKVYNKYMGPTTKNVKVTQSSQAVHEYMITHTHDTLVSLMGLWVGTYYLLQSSICNFHIDNVRN